MAWLNGDWDSGQLRAAPRRTVGSAADTGGHAGGDGPGIGTARPAAEGQDKPIGEAPEERKAEDIFLRGQRVLLGRGEGVVDFGQFYPAATTFNWRSVNGALGLAAWSRPALPRFSSVASASSTRRSSSPARHSIIRTVVRIFGSTNLAIGGRSEFGGVGVGVRRTLMRESAGRPDIVASFDAQIPTGDIPYVIGGGLVLVKSVDPVVLFANANYHHSFSRDLFRPRHASILQRESMCRSATAWGSTIPWRSARPPLAVHRRDGRRPYLVEASRYLQLTVRADILLAEGLYVEPSVSFGLGGPGNSFAFGVTVPYSF